MSFPNSALDDLIILRSGADDAPPAPTYNLAVVVDDHDMGVTHVIRGDDHLVNAARQQQIYQALSWPVPTFAHVPLIHGADGAKLSKRHGALGVEAYRDDGHLPQALSNYLLRLGWGHGDEEIIPTERAKQIFDLKGVNKAPARLDLEKLASINASYVKALSDEEYLNWTAPFLAAADIEIDAQIKARLERAAPFLKDRTITLKDAPKAAGFLTLSRPIALSGKAAKPLKKDGAHAILTELLTHLAEYENWLTPSSMEGALQEFSQAKELSFGQVGPPLRAALTGGLPAPSLGEVLFSLGKTEALQRIRDQIEAAPLAS